MASAEIDPFTMRGEISAKKANLSNVWSRGALHPPVAKLCITKTKPEKMHLIDKKK